MDWNRWSLNRKKKLIALCLAACTALSVTVGAHAMVEPTPDIPAQTEPIAPSSSMEPPASSTPASSASSIPSLPASSDPSTPSSLPPGTSSGLPETENPTASGDWTDGIPSAPDGSNHVSSLPEESSSEGANSGDNWSGGFSSSKPNSNNGSKNQQNGEDTEAPEEPQNNGTYSSYSPPADVNEDEINSRASSLAENKNVPDVLSSQNWEELLTDEPASNDPEIPVFGEEPLQDTDSSQPSAEAKSEFPWLLVFGLILIVLGLAGIGYFIYSQFFSEEDLFKKQSPPPKAVPRYTDLNSDSSGKQNRGASLVPENKPAADEPIQNRSNAGKPPNTNGGSRPVDPTADTDYIPPIPPVKPVQPTPPVQQAPAQRPPQSTQQAAAQQQKQGQQTAQRQHTAQGKNRPQKSKPKVQTPPPANSAQSVPAPPPQPEAAKPNPSAPKAQAQPTETPVRKDFDWEKFFSEDERK